VAINLSSMLLAAVDTGTIMIAIVAVFLPVGALVFALGAGGALRQIGKGELALESDTPSGPGGSAALAGQAREDEIRQMVEASSYRRVSRGEKPLDVEAEVDRLLAPNPVGLGGDPALREEVRQLVVARNERRGRQGKPPLEVEAEIDRQLRELESLGR
jgi:hypothetical protein